MLKDEKQILWRLSSGCLGAALPLVILGSGIMATVLISGIILGLLATKGNSLRSTIKFILKSKVLYVVGALFLALLASAYFSINQIHSMEKVGDLIGIGTLALLLYIALREMPTVHTDRIYRSLTFSLVTVASFCLIDVFAGSERFSTALHGDDATSPTRLVKMSGVFAVLLPFVWVWLFRRFREGEVLVKWLAVPITITTVLALFVSGGYVGWAAFGVALFIFLFHTWRYHGLVFQWKAVVSAFFVLIFALLCYGWSRGFNQPEDFASILHAEEFTPRIDLWQLAWSHMFDQPFTGIGVNTFRFLTDVNGEVVQASHPHNFLLHLFLETGMIGGLMSLGLLWMMIRYFTKASHSNLYGTAGLASIAAFLVAALTSTSLFHPWWLTMLVFSAVFSARVGWAIERKE